MKLWVTATFVQYYASVSATLSESQEGGGESYTNYNYNVYASNTPALYNVPSFGRLQIYSRFRDGSFRYNSISADINIPSNVYFKVDGSASFTKDTVPDNNVWDLRNKYRGGTRRVTVEISGLPF